MGFLDFLFKPKEEIPNTVELNWDEPVPYTNTIDPLPREYSNRGITEVKASTNKKKPFKAYVDVGKKDGNRNLVHIGYFPTKEEAQKARWEFIESLK